MKHTAFDKLIKSFPEEPATVEQLGALEEKLAVHLSVEQLDFLLGYQGVCFQACGYMEDEVYVQSFLKLVKLMVGISY